MYRQDMRIRVMEGGEIEIIDPDLSSLPFIKAFDPSFSIQTAPLPGFSRPKFQVCRRIDSGLSYETVVNTPTQHLWDRHDELLNEFELEYVHKVHRRQRLSVNRPDFPEISLLDLKIELAKRTLKSCCLCAHNCKVNRLAGERGVCCLLEKAYVGEHFIHICEEPPINPSYVLNLQGCGLRCRYCQQYNLLTIRPKKNTIFQRGPGGFELTEEFWKEIDFTEARSLAFIGGNPDESTYAILKFLCTAPEDFELPIVWNCHGYSTSTTLKLLDKIVDVYVPDFKYGNDLCAETWSGIKGYFTTVCQTVPRMIAQDAYMIVRMLVLPGHIECCHQPALQILAQHRDKLLLRLMPQYAPDFAIRETDGDMARRPTEMEFDMVFEEAMRLNFMII